MSRTSPVFFFGWSREEEELQRSQEEHLGTQSTHHQNIILILTTAPVSDGQVTSPLKAAQVGFIQQMCV